MVFNITKIYKTFLNIDKVARHHYGESKFNIVKFIHYSFFSINKFTVFKINLDKTLLQPKLDLDHFKIITDLDTLRALRQGKNLPREFYYDEIHKINNFYLLISCNDIAYIHWIYNQGDPNRFLHLNQFDAELNYNTTMPEFRGKGLMNQMMRYILNDLKNLGFKNAYGVVNIDNYPAIKSMRNAGFKEFFHVKAVGPFNRKIRL